MRFQPRRRSIILLSLLSVGIIAALLIDLVPPLHSGTRTLVTTATAQLSPLPSEPFPAFNTAQLTPQQIRLLTLARAEYAKHPVSYDSTVLAYTGGNKEAWCADFVSWLMHQVGAAYTNPNSGSWRIPGVYTLQEYYQSEHRYTGVGSYQPQVGDVAFYEGRHTFDMFSTSHVALVVSVTGRSMTTLGGNEGGHLRLDTQPITAGENSLVGFGKLQ